MFEDEGQESLQQGSKSGGDTSGRQVGDVTALSSDGRGIVKSREKVYFADRVVPGDRVAFSPDEAAKPAAALHVKLLKKSADRCEHPCRHAAECPASEWGIVSYERQLSEKTELVRRVLRGVVPAEEVKEIWASPDEWGYRNRLTVSVRPREKGGYEIGYAKAARGAGFAPIRNCLLGTKTVGQAVGHIGWILRDARNLKPEALPDRISVYETDSGAGALAIYGGFSFETDVQEFLEFAQEFELPGGIWAATATKSGVVGERGTFWRKEECRAMKVRWMEQSVEVNPAGFAQVNEGAANLVLEALNAARSRLSAATVWDLYGGYGALGFAAAEDVSRLIVVEQNGLSKSTFEQLKQHRPSIRAEFRVGEVAKVLPRFKKDIGERDVVIVDPPKSGCHPDVLKLISESAAMKLVYLSCNPARLSRDLKILKDGGFRASLVQPVDFFPQTPEIEVLAIVER